MKIGIVLSTTPSYSETFFISKIKGLQNYGHTVILFTQTENNAFDLCEVQLSYPMFKNNIFKQLGWFMLVFLKLMMHFRTVLGFVQLEKQQGDTLIQVLKKTYTNAHILTQKLDWLHFGFATMALGKENVAKSIGANMAVSLRGFDIAIYPIKHPHCYDLLWQRVDKVHSISDDLYRLSVQHGLSTIVPYQKITPAIDVNTFKNFKEPNKNTSRKQFITIARLHWKKGLTDTLKAFKILKEHGFEFNYTIVGDGELYEALTYTIHVLDLTNNVVLVGKKSHTEVKELLSQHEYYVQYSISEGFCNAVLEAQAMGLLCIVSDAEGLSENILDTKSGWVVPKRNPQKLANRIQLVSKMLKEDKTAICNFAINRVRSAFNLEKQHQEFLKFYMLDEKVN